MELVYLWVEDYKNIKNQGFNFSPRFRCEYDKDNNELTIEENEDYIPNFFGENINVTAIVGKNGSGKSSVLFQEQGSGTQEWTINFKIFFKNNILVLLEPFQSFWDNEPNGSPCMAIFKINNKTKYKHKLLSSYDEFDLMSQERQYFKSEASEKKLDYDYSIYFDWDVLKYLDYDNLNFIMSGTYGFHHANRNILSKETNEELYEEDDEKKYDFKYKVNTTQLKEKIYSFLEKNKNNLTDFFDFEIDFNEANKFSLFGLSHGQRSLVIFVCLILEEIRENNNKDLVIYLDEPDIALHPQWQKSLLNKLKKISEKEKEKNIHFIITTHSPFILSDIPKQNIIFLDKDEKGNCKVVDGLKEKKQTFGANIHTLLSDSFFMEDGLMGEFAKGKIDKAIKLLNQDNLDEKDLKYCEQIISIIGEPIVKNQLQRMLDSKRLKKIDEIDAIKKSMEEMQKRLDELEK